MNEVIVPAYTFVATASSVLLCGARPVFADLDLSTYNLDPADTESKITSNTRALMPVHFAGLINNDRCIDPSETRLCGRLAEDRVGYQCLPR